MKESRHKRCERAETQSENCCHSRTEVLVLDFDVLHLHLDLRSRRVLSTEKRFLVNQLESAPVLRGDSSNRFFKTLHNLAAADDKSSSDSLPGKHTLKSQ